MLISFVEPAKWTLELIDVVFATVSSRTIRHDFPPGVFAQIVSMHIRPAASLFETTAGGRTCRFSAGTGEALPAASND
jgi:hypothetical protein